MPDQLADIIWATLTTGHRHLALGDRSVHKYPADVAPFAAFAPELPAEVAAAKLHALMHLGEMTHIIAEKPLGQHPGLTSEGALPNVQMAWPDRIPIPKPDTADREIVRLACPDAPEMMELIEIGFPGFSGSEPASWAPIPGCAETAGSSPWLGTAWSPINFAKSQGCVRTRAHWQRACHPTDPPQAARAQRAGIRIVSACSSCQHARDRNLRASRLCAHAPNSSAAHTAKWIAD